MKKIIPIVCLLFFTACEQAKTWLVTVTTKTERWNAYQAFKIDEKTTSYTEVIVDYSEKEIKEYCKSSFYMETYGSILYKYSTTKTYVEQE